MPEDDDGRMVLVFRALADPTRQLLLDRLHADDGQTLGALCRDLGMTRQGITQHLAVLEAAGLVRTVRQGRQKRHHLDPVPLHQVHERWIAKFELPDPGAPAGPKRRPETDPGTHERRLVYVTYIDATPEQVWRALTDPEQTLRYWNHRNVSGWAAGDDWTHRRTDGHDDVVGTVLAVDPPRRLVHSWASAAEAGRPDRESRVTFDIEPSRGVVRLTLTHEELPADQVGDVSGGWRLVLANLKTMLETGEPMGLHGNEM